MGERKNLMWDRGLIKKESNDGDRRSATVTLARSGEKTLLRLVSGAAQLQEELLAPLPPDDRAHFLRCMKLLAEPPSENGDRG
jgi:DNA-binding MarR family transcriptional regulator